MNGERLTDKHAHHHHQRGPEKRSVMEVWSSVKAAVAEVADKARANIEQALLDEDLGRSSKCAILGVADVLRVRLTRKTRTLLRHRGLNRNDGRIGRRRTKR